MTEPSEPFDADERARRRPDIELPGPDWDGWTKSEPDSSSGPPPSEQNAPWGSPASQPADPTWTGPTGSTAPAAQSAPPEQASQPPHPGQQPPSPQPPHPGQPPQTPQTPDQQPPWTTNPTPPQPGQPGVTAPGQQAGGPVPAQVPHWEYPNGQFTQPPAPPSQHPQDPNTWPPAQPGPGQPAPGPYQQGPYQQGPYQQGPYQQGPYQPNPNQPSQYEPAQVPPFGDPAAGFVQPPTGQIPGPEPGYDLYGKRLRPWWGLGDVLLSIPFILFLAIVGTFLGLLFVSGDERSSVLEDGVTPTAMLATGLIFQQGAQLAWPFIVSKWKGLGAKIDWRLRFKPIDIGIGLGVAIGVLIVVTIIGAVLTTLVSEDTVEASENTSFLSDAEGSPWLWVLIFGAVIGAPVVEEIFFRGLTMRAIEKRFWTRGEGPAKILAIIGSTIIFVIPHWTGAGLAPTLILFVTIGVVGAVLGAVAMHFDRLGPAIVAHMVFNAVGVTAALATSSATPLTELLTPLLGV